VQNLQKIQTFVLEVGRGTGVLERSLEITEVLRGEGRRWRRQEAGLHIFWKKVQENLSLLSCNEFKLATNKTLGYDMPRVKLNMMCTARFWIDSRCTYYQFITNCYSFQTKSNVIIFNEFINHTTTLEVQCFLVTVLTWNTLPEDVFPVWIQLSLPA